MVRGTRTTCTSPHSNSIHSWTDCDMRIGSISTSQNEGTPINSMHAASPPLAPRHDRGICSVRGVQGRTPRLPSQAARGARKVSICLGSARNQRQSKGSSTEIAAHEEPPYRSSLCVPREHAFSVAGAPARIRLTAAHTRRFSSQCAVAFMRTLVRILRLAFAHGLSVALALSLAPVCSLAQVQTLTLDLEPAGLLYNVPASVSLTHTGTTFTAYTGTVAGLQYKARTSSTGGGTITVKATTDFPCASGGPCIATPPTTGDALTYTCSGATLGTNCSGPLTVSTTASTNIVTIPASACTGAGSPCNNANPNTVSVSFTLTDDPKYKTGNYSATLTWTISAT